MISTDINHDRNPYLIGIVISIAMFFVTLLVRFSYFRTIDFPFATIMMALFFSVYALLQNILNLHVKKKIKP